MGAFQADGMLTIGMNDHAQELLGDLVFAELPNVGKGLAAGRKAAAVESVKVASNVYAPVAGTVVETDTAVVDSPECSNRNAYTDWLFRLKPDNDADVAARLDAAAYASPVDA